MLRAQNGGTLSLNNSVANGMGGQLLADGAGSQFAVNGVAIDGGTLTETDGGRFVFNSGNGNLLSSVTFNGPLDLTNGGRVRTFDSFALTGTASLDNNAFLTFETDQTFGGNSTAVVFGATGTNRLNIEGSHTLTIAAGTLIHGENGRLGGLDFVGGSNALVNNGTIRADVSGGTITTNLTSGGDAALTNNATLRAQGGGTFSLNNNVTNGVGGHLDADGVGQSVP